MSGQSNRDREKELKERAKLAKETTDAALADWNETLSHLGVEISTPFEDLIDSLPDELRTQVSET